MRGLLALLVLTACTAAPPAQPVPDAGGIVDPLSMPAQATVNLADVPSVETCKACHPRQAADWAGSRHAYAVRDPVFQALVGARHAAFAGQQDKFCVQCHTIAGVRSLAVVPGFQFSDLPAVPMEGVTCWSCHAAASIARLHNAGLNMANDGAMRGNLVQPLANSPHGTVAAPFLQSAEFCGTCHEIVELHGLPLERPYSEWADSPSARVGQSCADCHMPKYDDVAALGGPPRTGLRSHRFVGLDPPGAREAATADERAAWVTDRDALLATAAAVSIAPEPTHAGDTMTVTVNVTNRIAGHSLPTGSTFIRQCWLEVRAVDSAGKVLYETGTFDANDDLRDRWSALAPYGDPDLVSFSSAFVDGSGQPTLFPWLAVEHHRNQLRAGEQRTYSFFVQVPAGVTGPVQLTARLRLRTYPPFLVRLLGLDAALPTVLLTDLATAATAVSF